MLTSKRRQLKKPLRRRRATEGHAAGAITLMRCTRPKSNAFEKGLRIGAMRSAARSVCSISLRAVARRDGGRADEVGRPCLRRLSAASAIEDYR
jgi:hypothetical protein